MEEFSTAVASRLGLEQEVVKKALGALLRYFQKNSGSFDFDYILEKIPGAEKLMRDSETVPQSEKGGLQSSVASSSAGGGIVGLIFTLLQIFGILALLRVLVENFLGASYAEMLDSMQEGAQLTMMLEKLGVDRDQGLKMVRMLVDYLKGKVDPETVDLLKEHIPALKVFLETEKKNE